MIKNLIKIFKIFLQRVPENISIKELEGEILEISDIDRVHHTHVWTLDGEHNFLSAHVVVTENTSPEKQIELKEEIRRILSGNNIHHVTVEIDFPDENCNGTRCQF